MHLAPLIQDLAVILGVAGLVSLTFQRIGQPVILGYLVAGVIIGPHTPPFELVADETGIRVWSELGIIFLMFSLGLELGFGQLIKAGRTALITAPVEVVFMMAVGYFAGKIVGWNDANSLFLGGILSISSTTVIIKSLEELGLMKERFAELVFSVLVIEDLLGILLMVLLGTMDSSGRFSFATLGWETGKLIAVLASWIVIGVFFAPRVINYVAQRAGDEALTIVALALCLGLSVMGAAFGYSPALGAFAMGLLLAEGKDVHRIERLMLPIRDVFASVFFVSIGMLLSPQDVIANWQPILAITVITLAGKVASTMLGGLLSGQSRQTSLHMGMALAQIGEFSFIIAGIGLSLGVIEQRLYTIAVSVSIITTFTTPYMLRPVKKWKAA